MRKYVCFLIAGLLMTATAYAWTFNDVTQDILPTPNGAVGAVAWGDINGDGLPDLFVGGTGDSPSKIYVNQSGLFSDGTLIYGLPEIYHVRSAQWVDFDSDGLLDIVCMMEPASAAQRSASGIRLFKQTPNHRYQEVTISGVNTNHYIRTAAWTDLNQDGRLDLILSNESATGPAIALAQNQLQFTELRGGISDQQFAGVGAVCVVDFDNDGDQDIFMGAGTDGGVSHLLRNDNGHYTDVANDMSMPTQLASTGAVWADFNGDGYMDLFAPGDDEHAYLLSMKLVDNHFKYINTAIEDGLLPEGGRSNFAHAIDANMDGRQELFLPRSGEAGCAMMVHTIYDGWINVADEVGLRQSFHDNRDGAWADIDGDGDLDLAIAQGSDGVHIFRNNCSMDHEFVVIRLTGTATVTPQFDCDLMMHFTGANLIHSTAAVTCGASSDYTDLLIVNPTLEHSLLPVLKVQWPNGAASVYDRNVIQLNQVNTFSQPRQRLMSEPAGDESAEAQVSNSPNPFNPSTMISFTLPEAGNVRLSVFNLLGQEVAVLADQEYAAGSHRMNFNAADLPSGLYFARLTALGQTHLQRMILTK